MSEASLADFASRNILALGGEPHRAVAALVEPVENQYRLAGWQEISLRTADAPDVLPSALAQAARRLGDRLGCPLWDAETNAPHRRAQEPALGLAVGQVVAVADVLPPLRVWLAGLTGGESLAAAQAALAGAVCRLVAVYRPGGHDSHQRLAQELARLRPDVAIVAGGYDRADRSARTPVLSLCTLLAQAIQGMPSHRRPLLCFAGNRWAAAEALQRWRSVPGDVLTEVVANVCPAPGERRETGLAVTLSQHYWGRSRALPALQRIAGWIARPAVLRSTNWAFAQAVRIWREAHDLADLHGLYTAPDRWLHVWASHQENGVRVRFVEPASRPAFLGDWPPLRLVSGPWPPVWPRPPQSWRDPLGLVPVIANIGQVAPQAVLEVMARDLLDSRFV